MRTNAQEAALSVYIGSSEGACRALVPVLAEALCPA